MSNFVRFNGLRDIGLQDEPLIVVFRIRPGERGKDKASLRSSSFGFP